MAAVPTWQDLASLSFRDSCATYEEAGAAAPAACDRAAAAVRRYGEVFEEGYERVKRLQREGEDCEQLRAQNEADAAREELEHLKVKAGEEHEKIEEAGREAGLAVEDARSELPAVEFPSPPAAAGGIPAGGRLKVPDPGESPLDRLFGRDYVYPEEATQFPPSSSRVAVAQLYSAPSAGSWWEARRPGRGEPASRREAGSRRTRGRGVATHGADTSG